MWRDVAETVLVLAVVTKIVGDVFAATVLSVWTDSDESARYAGVSGAAEPTCVLPGVGERARLAYSVAVLGVVVLVVQPPVSIALGRGGVGLAELVLGANLLAGYGVAGLYLADGLAALGD